MRICPRCRSHLREIHGQVIVDHCDVCRGNFFDTHTLVRSWGAAANPELWVEHNIAQWQGNAGLRCPADGEPLDAYRLSWGKTMPVEIDVCPRCRGLWLDEHESGRMRAVIAAHEGERAGAEQRGWKSYLFQLFTGLPVEVWNPVRRTPWFLYGLVVSLVAVFGCELWALGAVANGEAWVQVFMLVPAEVMAGRQLHGIVTHAFLHAGFAHLLGNLYFLWVFGDNIEDRVGVSRFITIYSFAGLAAAAVQVLSDPASLTPVLGASGAISGVMGAYVAMFPRVRVWVVLFFFRFQVGVLWYFGMWIAMQVASAWLGVPGVAWYAHIGGFVAGGALGMLFRRPLRQAS